VPCLRAEHLAKHVAEERRLHDEAWLAAAWC
jgi:hypothetical protein